MTPGPSAAVTSARHSSNSSLFLLKVVAAALLFSSPATASGDVVVQPAGGPCAVELNGSMPWYSIVTLGCIHHVGRDEAVSSWSINVNAIDVGWVIGGV
jgi:hypothetical protein